MCVLVVVLLLLMVVVVVVVVVWYVLLTASCTLWSGSQTQAQYRTAQKDALTPHVYYLSYTAYEALLRSKQDQCFVIRCE